MKKKFLSLLVVLMFIGLSVNSQGKSNMDVLTSGKWYWDFGSQGVANMGYYFTTDSMVFWALKPERDGQKMLYAGSLYYLSDKIDSVFDSSKVGKNKDGKYIISYDYSKLYVYEIESLNETELNTKWLWSGEHVKYVKRPFED